jgi:hypothetical protein
MIRHASVEELAKYDEDDVRPRKHARIAAHLRVCVHCTANHERLHAVANVLADVSYPPMPEHLSARINVAIASESAARVASDPTTEAGRGALPERQRPAREGFRLSRLSSPLGLRLVAAAGAAVIVAGGGYAIATGLGSAGPSSTSSAPNFSSNNLSHASLTPYTSLRVTSKGRTSQIEMVKSNTNFKQGTFKTQALAAVNAQQKSSSNGVKVPAGTSVPGAASGSIQSSSAGVGFSGSLPTPSVIKLQGCVGLIAAGRTLLLVESARFDGHGATIIVVRPSGTGALEAYAVGSGCSATAKDVLFSIRLPRP